MRAILIDAYNKDVKFIDLPVDVNAFQKKIRLLLKTDQPKIIHGNEMLTIIYEEEAHWNNTAPAFFSELMKDRPLFGNVICVGRNPITQVMEDLYHEYRLTHFMVSWCDTAATLHYRKIVRDFARTNRI